MNKKLLALLFIAILAIVSVGGVYAFDLGSMLGDDSQDLDSQNSQKITIDGIDFNIPAEFEENTLNDSVQYNETVDGIPYFSSIKSYHKGNTSLSMSVSENEDHEATDDTARAVGGESETINGIDGYLKYYPPEKIEFENGNTTIVGTLSEYYIFSYAQDGKLVLVRTTDKNIFSDVLIG